MKVEGCRAGCIRDDVHPKRYGVGEERSSEGRGCRSSTRVRRNSAESQLQLDHQVVGPGKDDVPWPVVTGSLATPGRVSWGCSLTLLAVTLQPGDQEGRYGIALWLLWQEVRGGELRGRAGHEMDGAASEHATSWAERPTKPPVDRSGSCFLRRAAARPSTTEHPCLRSARVLTCVPTGIRWPSGARKCDDSATTLASTATPQHPVSLP